MPHVAHDDIDRMRDALFFDGADLHKRLSRFWILLILAAIIASAGVVADSTATVIGAMIVAPLMTPILGTMFAVVLGDRTNLVRSVGLVLAGAAAAIAIGFLVAQMTPNDVVAATNGQVAGRIHPRLVDLLAAVATGAVGSVALARPDISDTLPGVAIAISLVPPLSVVGITAEAGAYSESAGALVLFATNVAAILATGIVVMAVYGVHRFAPTRTSGATGAVNRRQAILVIAGFFVLIGIPLTGSSIRIARETADETRARRAVSTWAGPLDWEILDVISTQDGLDVRLVGPPPFPDTAGLVAALETEGLDPNDVVVEYIPRATVALAGGGR